MGLGPFFLCAAVFALDLHALLDRTLTGLGYELVDLETPNRGRLLRVFMDREGGVTVDDCARVSNHLTRLFAVEAVDYDRLEVSSPGLDRPLRKPADFRRFAGQPVKLKLFSAMDGRMKYSGVIGGVDETGFELQMPDRSQRIEFADIESARLAPDFGPAPRKRKQV